MFNLKTKILSCIFYYKLYDIYYFYFFTFLLIQHLIQEILFYLIFFVSSYKIKFFQMVQKLYSRVKRFQ